MRTPADKLRFVFPEGVNGMARRMIEGNSTEDQSPWPPVPTTQAGNIADRKNGSARDFLPKNVLTGATVGVAIALVFNFCFMTAGDILWLAIKRKLMPNSPPANSYFGTGTPSFCWIMAALSLVTCFSILFVKRPVKPTVTLAYVLGACLTSGMYVAFWLLVENINLL